MAAIPAAIRINRHESRQQFDHTPLMRTVSLTGFALYTNHWFLISRTNSLL